MQRAVACAGLARGETTLTRPSFCDDALAALRVAEALGASVERSADRVRIRGGYEGRRAAAEAGAMAPRRVSCGESGLCMRMYASIASLSGEPVELLAEGSLAARPMSMVEEALLAAGVSCASAGGKAPLRIRGPLRGGTYAVDGSKSSQFLTGLLIALARAPGDSTLRVESLASRGYIDLSLAIMRHFGAQASRDEAYSRFSIAGESGYEGRAYEVEGDWSGGAFLLVAGAIAAGPDGLRVEGLSPESSQPDRAILRALELAGARCDYDGGAFLLRRSALRGFSFDASDCPDLFPPLAALASRCEGSSRIRGASRLKDKESDRAEALIAEFASLGLPIVQEGDELVLRPEGGAPEPLSGGLVRSRGDHRIAMAAAVAALAGSDRVGIEGAGCAAKSYPAFFEDLAGLGASVFGGLE
jgi:3-phosphoshikimate 1-carboxyvinyltransferase